MSNHSLLKLLRRNGRSSDAELAERVSLSADEVREQIAAWEADGTVLGYEAVVDSAKTGQAVVVAVSYTHLTLPTILLV